MKKDLFIDLVGLLGVAGVGYGTFLIYPPAMYIVLGVSAVAVSIMSVRK